MTDKELIEVSNRVWDFFADQMPEEFTGRDLLKIISSFVVKTADTLDMKPTAVCIMMYDRLNDERHSAKVVNSIEDERHSVKVVNSIENVLLFAGIVIPIIGALCVIWFDYKLGVKMFDVGWICILAYWALKFVVKVIGFVYLWRIRK